MVHRPRRSRSPSAVEFHLQQWARVVQRAERGGPEYFIDCPCCSGEEGLEARDRLEAIIRRGGHQGRRTSAATRTLDERFERATFPSSYTRHLRGWWWNRAWD